MSTNPPNGIYDAILEASERMNEHADDTISRLVTKTGEPLPEGYVNHCPYCEAKPNKKGYCDCQQRGGEQRCSIT